MEKPKYREKEIEYLTKCVEDVFEGVGHIVYISGMPGTGKTMTAKYVAQKIQSRRSDFMWGYVNCAVLDTNAHVYSEIMSTLQRKSRKAHEKIPMTDFFDIKEAIKKEKNYLLLILDEIDYIITVKHDMMYNMFDLVHENDMKLVIFCISNTIDLLENKVSNRIRSRVGSTRLNFSSYEKNEMISIAKEKGYNGTLEALEYCAKKVTAVHGDIRRMLEVMKMSQKVAGNQKIEMKHIVEVFGRMSLAQAEIFVRTLPLYQKILIYVMRDKKRDRIIHITEKIKQFCVAYSTRVPQYKDVRLMVVDLFKKRILIREGTRLNAQTIVKVNIGEEEIRAYMQTDIEMSKLINR